MPVTPSQPTSPQLNRTKRLLAEVAIEMGREKAHTNIHLLVRFGDEARSERVRLVTGNLNPKDEIGAVSCCREYPCSGQDLQQIAFGRECFLKNTHAHMPRETACLKACLVSALGS